MFLLASALFLVQRLLQVSLERKDGGVDCNSFALCGINKAADVFWRHTEFFYDQWVYMSCVICCNDTNFFSREFFWNHAFDRIFMLMSTVNSVLP